MKIPYSIVLSLFHPVFSVLYADLVCESYTFSSEREAIQGLKSHVPDIVVADFSSNNYAGVNVSNLDVLLHSLQKYRDDSKKTSW